MSSPSLHPSSDAGTAERENEPSGIRISLTVAHRYTFNTDLVTGSEIKETAGVPAGFTLHRRTHGGNESIPDDAEIALHNGDHFFARPPSSNP
ncbi:MAG: hypothetical protein ACRDH7_09395 [Actinomycetota bacterium]